MSFKVTPKKLPDVNAEAVNKHKFKNTKALELAEKHASTIAPQYKDEPNCENIVSCILGKITYGVVYAVVTVISFVKYLLNCCCDTDAPIVTFEDSEADEVPKKVEKKVQNASKEKVQEISQPSEEEPPLKEIPALSPEDRIAVGTVITNLATQSIPTLSSGKAQGELFKLGAPFRSANPIAVMSYILDHKSKKVGVPSLSEHLRAIPKRTFFGALVGDQIWGKCLVLIGAGLANFKDSPTYEADLKLFAEVHHLNYETLDGFLAKDDWDGFIRHIFKM